MEDENKNIKDESPKHVRESKLKDYVKNYNKAYYEKNKEKQTANMRATCKCRVCNCNVVFYKKKLHSRSKKHTQLLEISPYKTEEEIFIK